MMLIKHMLTLPDFDSFRNFSINFESFYNDDDFKLNNIDVRNFLNKIAIKRLPELLDQLEPYLDWYTSYWSRNFDKVKPLTDELNLKPYVSKLKNWKRYYSKEEYKLIAYLLSLYKQDKLNDIDKNILLHLLDKQLTIEELREEKELALNDLRYFLLNYWYVKNKIVNIDEAPQALKHRIFGDKLKYIPYLIQFRFLDLVHKSSRVVSVKTRQIGFTTSLAGYLSLYAIANPNKTILIISKSFEDAKITLEDSVKFPLMQMPFFLRKYVAKEIISLVKLGNESNTSTIKVMTSGKSSGRSISASILVLDEANFISNVDKLLSSAAPTLSATGGKGIVLSTPEEPGLFQELVVNADSGKNGLDIVLGYLRLVEDRDLNWYKSRIKDLNFKVSAIKTELEMELLNQQTSIIPSFILDKVEVKTTSDLLDSKSNLSESEKESVKTLLKYMPLLDIIEPVYPNDSNRVYLISVDTYEGGIDTNAISILDISKGFDEVKIIAAGKTKVENIADSIVNVAKYLNRSLVLVEKNRGYHLIHELYNQIPDRLLPNFSFSKGEFKFNLKSMRIEPDKLGLYTTREIKNKAISLLVEYLVSHKVVPLKLYEELKYLKVFKTGRIEGLKGDDIIMSVSIGLLYTWILTPAFDSSKSKAYLNEYHQQFIKLFKRKYKSVLSFPTQNTITSSSISDVANNQKLCKWKRIYFSI